MSGVASVALPAKPAAGPSLRWRLMLGILVPVCVVLGINSVLLYRQALEAVNTAYDRTLLASAKAIGEQLEVVAAPDGSRPVQVHAFFPYSSLEAFEADTRSRLFYKVSGFGGETVSGFGDLPPWTGTIPAQGAYAALVHFYDDHYRSQPVRMAVLLQPVAGPLGQGMATVQVAETLELRQTLARQILLDTVWRQLALVAAVALVVVWVVQQVTRPVRALGADLARRSESDLSPLPTQGAPAELQPLLEATNQHMARLDHLLAHQKRFVRDASHQLRTPLAVLKAQVQSARRGDVPPDVALAEMAHTVEDATTLANQMLALAKAEQLQSTAISELPLTDWGAVVRQVALDVSPLAVEHGLDFGLELPSQPLVVRAHEWALREVVRNLLHNAIRHSPSGAELTVLLAAERAPENGGNESPAWARLTVRDGGPGISAEFRPHLFQPFARGSQLDGQGTGLGLAICHGIVQALGGGLSLDNRLHASGQLLGLDAVVRLPLCRSF